MRTIKLLSMAALCASSLTRLSIAPAMAQNATSLSAMNGQCTSDLGALPNASATLHDGTLVWSTELDVTGSSDGAPSEDPGTRVETPGTRSGLGTPSYSGFSIAGQPYRIGGSVNMFGDRVATNKNWPNSEYDFTAIFSVVTTYSYACRMYQATETHHDAVYEPGKPLGYYTNPSEPNGGGQGSGVEHGPGGQSCSGLSPANPHWGEDIGACIFTKTGDGEPVLVTPESWTTDPVLTPRPDLDTTHTYDETNHVPGSGHATDGGPWTETGNWFVGQVVICISPSKTTKSGVPGAWQNQNGYTGTNCTTTYFNTAPWGGRSQTSNGTYISVPGV